jgi:hypothetical protein
MKGNDSMEVGTALGMYWKNEQIISRHIKLVEKDF